MSESDSTAPAAASERAGIVRIAVPKPLYGLFDYGVPLGHAMPAPGMRVQIPFGRQRLVGLCVATDPEDAHPAPRMILACLDEAPALSPGLLSLGQWLADYYHHPIGEVLALLLPPTGRKGGALAPATPDRWRPVPGASPDDPALKRAPRQRALLRWLNVNGPAELAEMRAGGFSDAVANQLRARGLILREVNDPLSEPPPGPAAAVHPQATGPELNTAQARALAALPPTGSGYRTALLEGVTGSGKTEVYLRYMAPFLAAGQQVLVLVPEIALTPQTLARFNTRFGPADAYHSQQPDGARRTIWHRCRTGEARIVIGTRSAVLLPFARLGLIIVDEEHDGSFKQQEGLRYSARDVAVKRAHDEQIPLLLGSATPSLESLHNAQRRRYLHLQLPGRAGGASMPTYRVLDVRGQVLREGLSEPLVRVIGQHLTAGNQVLVYLNRRGFAPALLCSACGWQAPCPNCEARLTYHQRPERLICHHCGYNHQPPRTCGGCGGQALLPVGVGTQRTEAGLKERFPEFPVHRLDRDAVRTQNQLIATLDAINQGEPGLLLGTQLLAKGHHFPAVTLVAVLNADAGFASADFKAPERTAQLIVQVAGRAGRAERPGEVWIQTYQPDDPNLQALLNEGYPGFVRRALAEREAAAMPPFRPLCLLRAESGRSEQAEQFLRDLCKGLGSAVEVYGPVPAPMARMANRFRWQVMLMAAARPPLHQALRALTAGISSPSGVRWSIDVDPYDCY